MRTTQVQASQQTSEYPIDSRRRADQAQDIAGKTGLLSMTVMGLRKLGRRLFRSPSTSVIPRSFGDQAPHTSRTDSPSRRATTAFQFSSDGTHFRDPIPCARRAVNRHDKVSNDVLQQLCQQGEKCSICLAKYDKADNVIQLHSSGHHHYFHADCIFRWQSQTGSTTCPLCRKDIFKSDVKTGVTSGGISTFRRTSIAISPENLRPRSRAPIPGSSQDEDESGRTTDRAIQVSPGTTSDGRQILLTRTPGGTQGVFTNNAFITWD